MTSVMFFGNQVDAGVGPVESGLAGGPLGPQPDVSKAIPIDGILLEIRLHETLE